MAFVFASERKLGELPQKQQFPSPAHYTIKEAESSRNCAPFRTTSLRKVAFEENIDKQIPGPGQYNVAKQIIKPKITAFSNTNNVIIKVNSTGTPQFKSITKRFEPIEKESPDQPQYDQYAYYIVKKEKKKHARNPMTNKTIAYSSKIVAPSIPTKLRGLLNPQNKEIIKLDYIDPGPGDYEISNRQKIISKGTIWGKDKIKRFNDALPAENGGPGYYDVGDKFADKSRDESSNFKSGTVRTFFDAIMYNSSSQYIAEHRKKINFKSPTPAPGQYAVDKSSFNSNDIKPQKFQFFGSSAKRFKNDEEKLISNRSTAFYVPTTLGANKSFNHLSPSFNSSSERKAAFLSVGEQVNSPGPGEYEDHAQPIKLKTGKQVQKFGSTAERIPQLTKTTQQQPPANENEVQLENQLLKSRFGQLQTESSMFKSKTHRICFSQAKNVTLDLEYDVTYNDVARKIQRQKAHLQNLRRIEVYKPPFEVNSPRFSHYEQWNIQKMPTKQSKDKVRKEKNEANPEKIISIGGKMGREERFHSERKGGGIPGVGNYQYRNEWKKNSHNVMFKHD